MISLHRVNITVANVYTRLELIALFIIIALGKEPGEEDDEAGEHHLQPYWDEPLGVNGVHESTARGTRRNEGADEPGDVVQTGCHTTMSGGDTSRRRRLGQTNR
jgi:hypothetical protein